MSHDLLTDASFFLLLERIDRDSVAALAHGCCTYCGGKLDRAYFWRKPRGIPAKAGAGPRQRASFCCRQDGCRRRSTPRQLLFLGRRVYASVVVVLGACLANGPTPTRLAVLEKAIGASPRTIRRWVRWWREDFPRSSVWSELRARLGQSLAVGALPGVLLRAFAAAATTPEAALENMLRFIVS